MCESPFFCTHWTEPLRRGAEYSLCPRACYALDWAPPKRSRVFARSVRMLRTGLSPPEEEPSFHSVRAHATCGGTKHPSSPWEVGEKCTPSDGLTTQALLRFMRPVHLPPGCVASMCLPSLAMMDPLSLRPSELGPLCVHVDQNPWRFPHRTLSPFAFLTSVSDGYVCFGMLGGSLRRLCLPCPS